MIVKSYEREINEFVETALRGGWAVAPRWRILKWYHQQRWSKSVSEDLKARAGDGEVFGDAAAEITLYKDSDGSNQSAYGLVLAVRQNCRMADD